MNDHFAGLHHRQHMAELRAEAANSRLIAEARQDSAAAGGRRVTGRAGLLAQVGAAVQTLSSFTRR